MSEIMLNVRDAARALCGTVHGSRLDYLVAALSADPETIEELRTALTRFLPDDHVVFANLRPGTSTEPWDAGVALIDLPARVIAVESTYSHPGPSGVAGMRDPHKDRDVGVPYHVAEDWKFVDRVEEGLWLADERRAERLKTPAVDVRPILYGKVCEFIAEACIAEIATNKSADAPVVVGGDAVGSADADATEDDEWLRKAISSIHARWLITPRADLGGLAPRDVLLARKGYIDWELQDRSEQWTMLGHCPPPLDVESAAYRYAAFGTHEIVVYYDLVRFLICDCWDHCMANASTGLAEETMRLEALRDEWLQSPEPEFHGRTPASVIENERRRIPEAMSGHEAIVDHDCPLCRMQADMPGPMFWGLDGSSMEDDFAFSFHRTREEWEAEQRRHEEFNRDFNRRYEAEQRAKQARGDKPIWNSSFSDEIPDSPTLMLFGLAAHLTELTQDLKHAAAEQSLIDDLNRTFGNLHAIVQEPSPKLLDPVIDRLCEHLTTLSDAHPHLIEKCNDLEDKLRGFLFRLTAAPDSGEDVPF